MAKDCAIDNMTVDAEVCGDVIEYETFDGQTKLTAGSYREVRPQQISCGDCADYLDVTHGTDINEVIKEHLEV